MSHALGLAALLLSATLAAACRSGARAPEPAPIDAAGARTSMPETEAGTGPAPESSGGAAASSGGASTQDVPQPGAEPAQVADEAVVGEDAGLAIHGGLRTWYRGRYSSDADDHDIQASLDVDVGDPTRDRFTFRFAGYLSWDLDGSTAPSDPFFGIADTYDQPYLRLTELYVDANRVENLETLRLGRQTIWSTPVFVWFDGLTIATEKMGEHEVGFGAYGGLPVRAWESSTVDDGNPLFGAWGEFKPWSRTRLRLDYLHLEDDTIATDGSDDLFNLQLWQNAGERLSFFGSYSVLEGESRDYRLRGSYADYENELTLQANFYQLLQTQRDLPLEIDPFYQQLLAWFPFYSLQLLASKGITEWLSLQGGLDARRVSDSVDEGMFNRDVDRYYVTALFDGEPYEPLQDFDLSLTWESWNGGGEDIDTWGADLGFERGRTRSSIGTYFVMYKFDALQVEETENVRTYYFRIVRELNASTKVDMRYEFEDSEFDDYHTLRLGLTWRF